MLEAVAGLAVGERCGPRRRRTARGAGTRRPIYDAVHHPNEIPEIGSQALSSRSQVEEVPLVVATTTLTRLQRQIYDVNRVLCLLYHEGEGAANGMEVRGLLVAARAGRPTRLTSGRASPPAIRR